MLSEGIRKENISARVEAGEAGGGGKIKDPWSALRFQCGDAALALCDEKTGSGESRKSAVLFLAFTAKAGSCSAAVGTRGWWCEHTNPEF